MSVDFGTAAKDYAQHRKSFPESTFQLLSDNSVGISGQRILDVGTGTGLFAIAFAKLGCRVTGLDISKKLLAEASNLSKRSKLDVTWIEGSAEDLPFDDNSFDVVTCATAWHWFRRDLAGREIRRVLKPGGKLVVAVLGWHFLPGNIATETLSLIRKFSPPTKEMKFSTLRYPEWAFELSEAGFLNWKIAAYVESIPYSHTDWCGRVRASQGVKPTLSEEDVRQFSAELEKLLKDKFAKNPYPIDHRIELMILW